jgi:hypothetical protein
MASRMRVTAVWLAMAAGAVRADDPQAQPSPSPTPTAGAVEFKLPPERSPDTTPKTVTVPGGSNRNRDSQDASPLRNARVLSIVAGEARVLLATGERVLRPGDVVGTDTVKTITPGRIVLTRSTAEGGAGLVVVSVDGQGRTRLRVYLTKEPGAVPPSN